VFIEAKDGGGGGDNWTTGAVSRAKLQSNHHHQHPVFLQAGCPSCFLKQEFHCWTCALRWHFVLHCCCCFYENQADGSWSVSNISPTVSRQM